MISALSIRWITEIVPMRVTQITVNPGNLTREGGFANVRLDPVLGLRNQGPGLRFAYAFQIEFRLEGISGFDVKVTRRVTHKTDYVQTGMRKSQQVIDDFNRKPMRNSDPGASEDSPNEGNIIREANRIVVQDGPGPSFGINDRKMYPMRFEGKFIIMVKNGNGDLLASVLYYVYLLKRQFDGQVEGGFEEIEETIDLSH
jgi:hypothetical protein